MRKLALILLILVTANAVSAAVKTTPPKKPPAKQRDEAFARLSKDLGLSKKQQDSIRAIYTKAEADMRKLRASKESNQAKQTKQRKLAEDTQKKVAAVLTPAQRKTLDEMTRARVKTRPQPSANSPSGQPRHRMSFADAMQKKLSRVKLTSTQKTKTDAILKDFSKRHAAIRNDQKLDATKRRAKSNDLKGETMKKIEAVLTPAQRKEFTKSL